GARGAGRYAGWGSLGGGGRGVACARAGGLHARHAPDELVKVTISDDPGGLVVTVVDLGPAAGPAPADLAEGLLDDDDHDGDDELVDPDVALALITGLVDGVEITPSSAGTTVTMRWPLPVGAAPGATAVSRT
ncbi:MAG: ATP-binding protein, partial [Frankiaceae bacterium]|nr:ATP-binding protein [Frankiaceae bacterium]